MVNEESTGGEPLNPLMTFLSVALSAGGDRYVLLGMAHACSVAERPPGVREYPGPIPGVGFFFHPTLSQDRFLSLACVQIIQK